MQGSIYLDTRENQKRKKGYPLTCLLTGNGEQKPFVLGLLFEKEDWDFVKEEPLRDKRKILQVRKKKRILEELLSKAYDDKTIDFEYVKSILKSDKDIFSNYIDFYQFGYDLADELSEEIDLKGAEKDGNARVYRNALNQLKKLFKRVGFAEIDYNLLTEFKKHQLRIGNSKSTVNLYIRTIGAIYREGLERYKLKYDHDPFKKIYKGITVQNNRTKKRNVSKETIKILELLETIPEGQLYAVELHLLQFYFGGQDMIDIYYLENRKFSNNDRVYFFRGKLEDEGYEFDLMVPKKAKKILIKRNTGKPFVFEGRKDKTGYRTFMRRIATNLVKVQERYNLHVENIEKISGKSYHKIEVLPLGGNLTTKVSRHTFATIGARKFINEDLLRALMGHKRNDVDTIYKDVFPEKDRDHWHNEIIDTSQITNIQVMYIYELGYIRNGKRGKHYRYFTQKPTKDKLITEDGRVFKKPLFWNKIYLVKI